MTGSAIADIGIIGLAVMGQNLVLNLNDHGYKVAVFNRTTEKTEQFLKEISEERQTIFGTKTMQTLVDMLISPKRIWLMVKAGDAVDENINVLLPMLSPGDIIIDGGNSHYLDSKRRCELLESHGILFVGAGVSGGEEGARYGPSIMPGGSAEAWPHINSMLQDISAKTLIPLANESRPCCDWVGSSGSGHFVKMVHNGIEYGDMQLISEIYLIMKQIFDFNQQDIANCFEDWKQSNHPLSSYLIDISLDIFNVKEDDGDYLLDKIRDAASQKGTGQWTIKAALDVGSPGTIFSEAVMARVVSSMKDHRLLASKILPESLLIDDDDKRKLSSTSKTELKNILEQALLAAKIIAYAQGFHLMYQASKHYEWKLNFPSIALMWQGGCIIRSSLLSKINEACQNQLFSTKNDGDLLLDSYFSNLLSTCQIGLRRVIVLATKYGIPIPGLSSTLSYYDGIRCPRSGANLIQAQRDYFGAHTYELNNQPGHWIHTNWLKK